MMIVEINPLLAQNLRQRFPHATVIECDFLEYHPDRPFDVVLMNPPFAGKSYIKHIRHAFSMLARMGTLASVVPAGFLTHDDEFLFAVAEAGQWENLGADRFDGTSCSTSIVWMENDPDGCWRSRPYEGYSSHYAWDATVSISSDSDVLTKLAKARDFAGAVEVLKEWARDLLRKGSATFIDEAVAKEVLGSLVADYDAAELARLIPVTKGQLELGGLAA
jgi:hypothetical protein